MGRSPLFRVVAPAIAVLVGVSTSSAVLAHGYAHHRLHDEIVREDRHRATSAASHHDTRVAVEAAHDFDEHAHPQLANAVSGRADLKVFIGPISAAVLPAPIELADRTSLSLTAAPARAGPPDAPPRQPRAPPLG